MKGNSGVWGSGTKVKSFRIGDKRRRCGPRVCSGVFRGKGEWVHVLGLRTLESGLVVLGLGGFKRGFSRVGAVGPTGQGLKRKNIIQRLEGSGWIQGFCTSRSSPNSLTTRKTMSARPPFRPSNSEVSTCVRDRTLGIRISGFQDPMGKGLENFGGGLGLRVRE